MKIPPNIEVLGFAVPRMFYGTAWKEDRTAGLTEIALKQGFRAIDTANQRKHYFEQAVGEGLSNFRKDLSLTEPVFLQTKFTFLPGQDHRLPYDPQAAIGEQVRQSFASSQQHLGVSQIDSLVLHGPTSRRGLLTPDWEAWRAMEEIAENGEVRFLGISNVSGEQLLQLLDGCKIRPLFVQNRCFAVLNWDREIRQICNEHEILYQGFSLLTANQNIFGDSKLQALQRIYNCTPAQLIYSFALHLGIIVLTGTTNEIHIRESLQAIKVDLDQDSVNYLESIAA